MRPSTVYREAVESLGGLRINASSNATPNLQSSPSRSPSKKGTRLGKSESLPVLPSYFDGKKASFVAITPTSPVAARTSAPRDVHLPPLTLSLKAVRGNRAEPSWLDEEHYEEEEEAVLSDDEHAAALNNFNNRHASRSTHARGLLSALEKTQQRRFSNALGISYDDAIGEVFRNRFWMKEMYDPFNPIPAGKKKRRRRHWKLEESTIWQFRKLKGNSHDYYENDESLRTIFDTDWRLACAGVARMVDRGTKWIDADDNGIHDSIDAAGDVLWKHYRMVLGTFDYYAVLYETVKDADGEFSVHDISFNAFVEFARDCNLIGEVGEGCSTGAVDVVWTTANALPHDALVQKLDRWNHRRLMCRHEFLQALLRLASEIYLKPHIATDLACAVDMLCDKLMSMLPPEALQDSNVFRKKRCYIESTDMTLRRNKTTLKAIFDVYSRANRNTSDELQDSKLMSCGEWMMLLQHAGLLESGQVSFFGAKIIFKWSMIRACEDHSAKSERKMRHLTFSDFCEAIVRVACIMALPNDEEIEEAHAQDAGEFLNALQSAGDGTLETFVAARKTGWRSAPKQHVSRCVHHLITLLNRTVREDLAQDNEEVGEKMMMQVEENEVIRFEERRRTGNTLHHVQSKAGLLDGVRASASIVRARQLEALRRVEIFSELTDMQFNTLCDAMSQTPFDEDEYVFEQGEEGDSFYIITEGEAAVVRTEPGSKEEKELCILKAGAFFGERALIKNQVRYAGIRAETKQLHTVFITRNDFERALGSSLEKLVPDQYHLDAGELLEQLTKVTLFSALTKEQIKLVANRCTEVKFAEKDDVVRQGDPGDAFYVITRGTADVLRWPEPELKDEGEVKAEGEGEVVDELSPPVQPELLTQLGQWQAFGERALIKNETRYASVRVTSSELHAMSISRDVFEAALGVRLADVMPPPPTGAGAASPAKASLAKSALAPKLSKKVSMPMPPKRERKQSFFAGESSYKKGSEPVGMAGAVRAVSALSGSTSRLSVS